jgi:hypothetical protein
VTALSVIDAVAPILKPVEIEIDAPKKGSRRAHA